MRQSKEITSLYDKAKSAIGKSTAQAVIFYAKESVSYFVAAWEMCDIQLFGVFCAVSTISNRSSKFSATRVAEQFFQRKMNLKRIISSSKFFGSEMMEWICGKHF